MSKVIFKLTFKNPNFKDTVSKNVSHVGYIATRSGVDKTVTEEDLKKELVKDTADSSDNETYAKYIDERPQSHGLFGKDGIEDLNEVKEELSQADSFVWRAIVSIKENDAVNLGYLDKEKWEDMLRKKIPDMAQEIGIRTTNLRWVAAVHMAKGHPHAHIMFWEKRPEKALGVISTKKLNGIRKLYTDEIFSEEREQLLNEKNIIRDIIIEKAKHSMANTAHDIKEINNYNEEVEKFNSNTNDKLDNFVSDIKMMDYNVSINPKLYGTEEAVLIEKLKHLSEIMPGNGRVALKFMPEDVKKEVREIANYLLQQPEFAASLERNLKTVEELTKMYTSDEESKNNIKSNYFYIVNGIANNLNNNGVDKEEINELLKKWTYQQRDQIKLSDDDREIILHKIKYDNKNYDVFNNFSMNIYKQFNNDFNISYEGIKEALKLKDVIDPVTKARDNAYNDIRDRVSQIILKGAAESMKKNIFAVDENLANKTVDFMKSMTNNINLMPEQTEVFNKVINVLIKTGHTDADIKNRINSFIDNQNLNYPKENIVQLIDKIKADNLTNKVTDNILVTKNVDYYLSVLKLSGYNEREAFKIVKETILNDKDKFKDEIERLADEGYLKINEDDNEKYSLTDKGIDELLKIKVLDNEEKIILKSLGSDQEDLNNLPEVSYKDLINDKDVFSSLIDKDPKEFTIGNFDKHILNEIGDSRTITFKQLEDKINETYENSEKADEEIEALEDRINKLALNGYMDYDKETGAYTFTEDGYNKIKNFENKMEFTLYDAKVTLSFIDNVENNVLKSTNLRDKLEYDVINKTAADLYSICNQLINNRQDQNKEFITKGESGNLIITDEGNNLNNDFFHVNKFFSMAYKNKTVLNDTTLKQLCVSDKQYNFVIKLIDKLSKEGYIKKDEKTGQYTLNQYYNNISKLIYYIKREKNPVNIKNIKSILEDKIPNKEAEQQYKYLIKRLDFLKANKYIEGGQGEYKLTEKGKEKREDILTPQKELLRKELKYLNKIGFISQTKEGNWKVTSKYINYINSINDAKKNKIERSSNVFDKRIANIIDHTQDNLNVNKIERSVNKITNGKYFNNVYDDLKTDYSSIRDSSKVKDTLTKTLTNIAKILLVTNITPDETKGIMLQWNTNSNSNIAPEKIVETVNKAYENVHDNNLWERTTVISAKEWKSTFESLGIKENEIPKWFYKGVNWEQYNNNYGLSSIVNTIWKALWNQLEKEQKMNDRQADYMRKHLIKQQAASQNKSAIKEQIKKNKDKKSFEMDDM